jgi:HK97 family phage major capsid protein/HK97 family phage prohead protease
MLKRAWSTLEIKSVDEEKRIIEGLASTPTTDRMGDVVEPKGAQFKLPLPLLWQHRSGEPIGQVIWAKATDAGIQVRAQIAKDLLPRIDEAWALIKSGLVRGLSIGFSPIESARIDGTFGMHFLSWEWLELSAVTIPANSEANIQSIKSADAEHLRAAPGRSGDPKTSTPHRPGASGSRSKGSTMKTLKELQQERDGIVARMKEIGEACQQDFSTLEADDAKEYDELASDLKTLDTNIGRAQAMEVAVKGAVAVTPDVGADPTQASRARMHRQAKQETPKELKGVALAQYVKMLWRAKGNPMHAEIMAKQTRGLDSRVPLLLKAAVASGSTNGTASAGDWGMELVGTETSVFADFVEFLRPQTIIGKFGTNGIPSLRRVPFRVPLIGMTDGGAGYWVGEGKAKPLTSFAFSRDSLLPLKVAAICVVNEELLKDSSPAADALLRDALAAALRERTDIDFIDPAKAASAGVSPASITNGITPTPATGTGDAADVRVDVKAAFGAFIAANNAPTSGVWIMPSTTALSLSLMMNALGQPEFPGVSMNGGNFAGLPVIASEHVPSVSAGAYVVLANAQDIYFADDGDVVVDTSAHASIEMSDNPEGESGTVVNMFQTNRVAFRAERRLDWMRRRESSVAVISNVNWGAA